MSNSINVKEKLNRFHKAGQKLLRLFTEYNRGTLSFDDVFRTYRWYVCLRNPYRDNNRPNIFNCRDTEQLDQIIIQVHRKMIGEQIVVMLFLLHPRCSAQSLSTYLSITNIHYIHNILMLLPIEPPNLDHYEQVICLGNRLGICSPQT
jgi:hypothetical protein